MVLRDHLLCSPTVLTVSDWKKTFISHLLQLTHGQWIYRNITKHHQRYGQLKNIERRELLREIDQLMQTSPDEVPEDSKFLLEIDFQQLAEGRTEGQGYWIAAMRAAITARRRAHGRWRHQQKRRRQMESLRRGVAEPLVPLYTFGADDNLAAFSAKRKHTAPGGSGSTADKSNKRLRKPD